MPLHQPVRVAARSGSTIFWWAVPALVSLGIGLLLPAIPTAGCRRFPASDVQLERIHGAGTEYAREMGRYPSHAAELLTGNWLAADWVIDFEADDGGNTMVGGYDLLLYDWSDLAKVALANAVATTDLRAPWYRFGDYWLVRLAAPTGHPRIVAGWSGVQSDDGRWVVLDDGQVQSVGVDGWDALWDADEEARQALGLPAIAQPWW